MGFDVRLQALHERFGFNNFKDMTDNIYKVDCEEVHGSCVFRSVCPEIIMLISNGYFPGIRTPPDK